MRSKSLAAEDRRTQIEIPTYRKTNIQKYCFTVIQIQRIPIYGNTNIRKYRFKEIPINSLTLSGGKRIHDNSVFYSNNNSYTNREQEMPMYRDTNIEKTDINKCE